MKVSVIIPCYNVAAYLPRCVESVLNQDVPTDWYEIILVDDGSTDQTPALCDTYTNNRKDAKVRVIHQANSGVASARNTGVAKAEGEWVAFLDSDDWWSEQYLREMLQLAETYPDAGLYGCMYWYVKYGRNEDRVTNLHFTKWITSVEKEGKTGYLNYFASYYAGEAMPVWTGAVIMPKRVFEEMGGFPAEVKLGEDFLLWAKTAMHYRVAYKTKCLSYYYNDVPKVRRLTKRLHPPKAHMDWYLDALDEECKLYNVNLYEEWSRLRDKLRATGLRAYWLSNTYHEAAAVELTKIDWSHLPPSYKQWYAIPRWSHRIKECIFGILSRVKQSILTLTRRQI